MILNFLRLANSFNCLIAFCNQSSIHLVVKSHVNERLRRVISPRAACSDMMTHETNKKQTSSSWINGFLPPPPPRVTFRPMFWPYSKSSSGNGSLIVFESKTRRWSQWRCDMGLTSFNDGISLRKMCPLPRITSSSKLADKQEIDIKTTIDNRWTVYVKKGKEPNVHQFHDYLNKT